MKLERKVAPDEVPLRERDFFCRKRSLSMFLSRGGVREAWGGQKGCATRSGGQGGEHLADSGGEELEVVGWERKV